MTLTHAQQQAEARRATLGKAGIRYVDHNPLLSGDQHLRALRAVDYTNKAGTPPEGFLMASDLEICRLTTLTVEGFHLNKGRSTSTPLWGGANLMN